MFLINRNSSFNYFYFKEWTRIAETQYQPGFISLLFQIWLGPSGSPTGQNLINRCLIQTDDITSVCRDRKKIRRFGMTNEPEKILRGECCSQRRPTCPTSEQHLPPRWRTREGLGSAILNPADILEVLTWFDGLPVWEGQRCNEEFGFCDWYPVVENFHRPDPRPQGQVQRGLVVGELGSGLNQDVVGGCDDVDGIHPDDIHGHIGALPPFLHAYRLIHGPQETPKVAEEPLFGIPVSTDLKHKSESWNHWAWMWVLHPRKA